MSDRNSQKIKLQKERKKALDYLDISEDEFKQTSSKSSGKILGIDYGAQRIGLAISDESQRQAFVYDTLEVKRNTFERIREICEQELIDKIVVGLPLGLSGKYTKKTEEVTYFIEELEIKTEIIVHSLDERMSSLEADKTKNSHSRDEESARIILQQYLDKQLNNS